MLSSIVLKPSTGLSMLVTATADWLLEMVLLRSGENQVSRFFRQHDSRRIGVARNQGWKN